MDPHVRVKTHLLLNYGRRSGVVVRTGCVGSGTRSEGGVALTLEMDELLGEKCRYGLIVA